MATAGLQAASALSCVGCAVSYFSHISSVVIEASNIFSGTDLLWYIPTGTFRASFLSPEDKKSHLEPM